LPEPLPAGQLTAY
nr:Chain C, LPEP peptide from EBV, P7A, LPEPLPAGQLTAY [synthetic construct]